MRVLPYLLLVATGLVSACGQKGPLKQPARRPATAVTAPAAPTATPGVAAPPASGAGLPAGESEPTKRADEPDAPAPR
jgi:predicted small lipoprotein YifL